MKKQSKTELLLNVVFKNKEDLNSPNLECFIHHCYKWLNETKLETVEELADDLGYFNNNGIYEEDLKNAAKKILKLANWFQKTFTTIKYKSNHTISLFESIEKSKIKKKLKIKMILYCLTHYKNIKTVNKKLKSFTGFDALIIEKYIISIIKNLDSSSSEKIDNNLRIRMGALPYYLDYYHSDINYLHKLVKNTLIEKKNKQMNIDINNIKQFHSKIGKFTKPCGSCGSQINGLAGLVILTVGKNIVVCESCCQTLIESGVEDLYNKQLEKDKIKNYLISFINIHQPYKITDKLNIEELQKLADSINLQLQKQKMIDDDIAQIFVETPTEQYLIDDYDVYETDNIKSHLQIENYFKSNGHEFFECGQGSYQDEVYVFLKIGNKFYDVTINADINSRKMDYGDRFYWVDKIAKVSYIESEKPEPKLVKLYRYELTLTAEQKTLLDNFLKTNGLR